MTSTAHSFTALDGTSRLGVVANVRYRMVPSRRRLERTGEAMAIRREPAFSFQGRGRFLTADSDLVALVKPSTDVLIDGSAYPAAGSVSHVDTGARVGPVRKSVRVWGNRTIGRSTGGSLCYGEPESFERMPLGWSRAYGGEDPIGGPASNRPARDGLQVYPRNYVGRGYAAGGTRERLVGTLAPNLEDPLDPATAERLWMEDPMQWIDAPAAASYGPVDYFCFPRTTFVLPADFAPPTRPVHELAVGALQPSDLADRDPFGPSDGRAFCCAPPGLGGHRLHGNERITLWNLHRAHAFLELELPGERPRILLEPPGCRAFELVPVLATLLVEPDQDRVSITWAASMPVAMRYPEEATAGMRHAVVFAS